MQHGLDMIMPPRQPSEQGEAEALDIKTLKRLARRGLIQWEHGWFFPPDIAALAEVAKFDLDEPRKRPLI